MRCRTARASAGPSWPPATRQLTNLALRSGWGLLGDLCQRQAHMEGCAAAGCGVDGDLPAVGGGQRRRDSQAEPGAAASAGAGAVDAIEALEHARSLFRC